MPTVSPAAPPHYFDSRVSKLTIDGPLVLGQALLKNVERTATVTAAAPTRCFCVDRAAFERLIRLTDVDFRSYDSRRGSLQMASMLDAELPVAPAFGGPAGGLDQVGQQAADEFVGLEAFEELGPTVGEGGYGTVFLARRKGVVYAVKAMNKAKLVTAPIADTVIGWHPLPFNLVKTRPKWEGGACSISNG